MNPHDELKDKERSLREDLANVQDVVLDLNREDAILRGARAKIEGQQKETAMDRHKATEAKRNRQEWLSKQPATKKDDRLYQSQSEWLEKLDHRRASLKAREQKIDEQIADLDARRRPFIESQQRLLEQIDQTVAARHDLHFEPIPRKKETDPMKVPGPDEFRRVSANKSPSITPTQKKPLASAQRLEELKKRLDKAKPAPGLNPPGMAPNLAKRVKANKAIGDEIVSIQKAMANRRGQARDGFKRSAGG
ncbi:hypothetical protein Pla108_14400 [Botrimarina colliarenosi]|uniref:Chromosome partition protein Smc n=1 Tax=Botrimarina colliarenosi TaxID=2528001 RepID=A0A5C6AMJ6_9BACT|nr:hypothetical protein [Botrimarina colliarenosi]TWU00489.1 hypothetical protein Pla108_14400 [Botrimarina colliarenosi]